MPDSVRIRFVIMSTGSLSDPYVGSFALPPPRAPEPLLPSTLATRCTYAGLGLPVTRRWMSCLPMYTGVFGCANTLLTIDWMSCSGVWFGGTTLPLSSVFVLVSCPDVVVMGYGIIGSA